MPIRYIGTKTLWNGKKVFEILGNLRNFGIGRYLIRSDDALRYPGTTSFYKILSVKPYMDQHLNKGSVLVEKVFRDVRYPEPVEIGQEIGFPDWKLVPRSDEARYRDFQCRPPTVHIFPKFLEPRLVLKDFLLREQKLKGTPLPSLEVTFPAALNVEYAEQWRPAQDGEAPNSFWNIPPRQAVPECPLYHGVEEYQAEKTKVYLGLKPQEAEEQQVEQGS